MKDKRGIYYYPNPQNHQFRTYVRQSGNEICFRLWNGDDPGLWVKHGWVPYEAICRAAETYKQQTFDPYQAYDLALAKILIEEDQGVPC